MNKRSILLGTVAAASLFAIGAGDAGAEVLNDHTEHWKELWGHVLLDIGVIGVVFGLMASYFLVAYRRSRDDQVGSGPKFSFAQSMAWALIPAFVFMADDFYLAASGWKLWNDQRIVPENALEVKLTGRMWSWDFDYGNGKVNTNEDGLVVPQGKPVVMRMKSEDAVHSFFIPEYRIKEDLMPGRVTYLWFYPKSVGEYVFTCTEFCGTNHSNMWGKVKVIPAAEFDAWLNPPAAEEVAAAPAEGEAAMAAEGEAAPAAEAAAPAGH